MGIIIPQYSQGLGPHQLMEFRWVKRLHGLSAIISCHPKIQLQGSKLLMNIMYRDLPEIASLTFRTKIKELLVRF